MPVDLSKINLINEPTIKTLSSAELKAINNADDGTPRYKPRWPSVRDKELIFAAAKEGKKLVKLELGLFKIRYSEGRHYPMSKAGIVSDEVFGTVYLSPANDDFAPCGWFSIENLERELT